jgi:SWIB/MDM2 domain-containing protein
MFIMLVSLFVLWTLDCGKFLATDRMLVNCDEKLKSIFLGKSKVDLAELPALIKLHFPKQPK